MKRSKNQLVFFFPTASWQLIKDGSHETSIKLMYTAVGFV